MGAIRGLYMEHRRWRRGGPWPPTFKGHCLQEKIEIL